MRPATPYRARPILALLHQAVQSFIHSPTAAVDCYSSTQAGFSRLLGLSDLVALSRSTAVLSFFSVLPCPFTSQFLGCSSCLVVSCTLVYRFYIARTFFSLASLLQSLMPNSSSALFLSFDSFGRRESGVDRRPGYITLSPFSFRVRFCRTVYHVLRLLLFESKRPHRLNIPPYVLLLFVVSIVLIDALGALVDVWLVFCSSHPCINTYTREKQATLPPAEKEKSLFEEYTQSKYVGYPVVESSRVESKLTSRIAVRYRFFVSLLFGSASPRSSRCVHGLLSLSAYGALRPLGV